MNLKNYFNEIKHFLKENVDDPENLGTEDTGEPSPEGEDVNQGEGDDPNNIPGQQNSTPPPPPSELPGQQAAGANISVGQTTEPTTANQGGSAGQPTGDPQTGEEQGGGGSSTVPPPQEETKKFGTILNELKDLFNTFEQAKKAAGFETIDDVKKAANENQTTGKVATNNDGGGTPAA